MTIVPNTATITVGKTVQFATNVNGAKWSSSTPAIASVTSSGLVTAKAVGTVMIVAKKGMQKASASVSVTAPAPQPVPVPIPEPVPVPVPVPVPTPVPQPPGGPSPDGSTIPPLAALIDAEGVKWTFGQAVDGTNRYILRNGDPLPGGGYGSVLLWYGGKLYTLGGNQHWYRWDGIWAITGTTAPNSSPAPQPQPQPVPSTNFDYVVSTTGSDAPGRLGTEAQPFLTFSHALEVAMLALAGSGKRIGVRGGTYSEPITNPSASGTSWANAITVANYNGEVVWLTPTSGDFAVYFGSSNSQYLQFDGININGNGTNAAIMLDNRQGENPNHLRFQNLEVVFDGPKGGGGGAINVGGTDHEFLNLNVHGIGGPYGFYVSGNNNLIDGCDIHDVASLGVHIYKYGGNPSGNIVRNTKIHDIRSSSFFGVPDSRIGGILIAGDQNQAINNQIADIGLPSFAGSYGGIFVYYGKSNTLRGNTMQRLNTPGIVLDSGAQGTVVDNNPSSDLAGAPLIDGGVGTVVS